MNRQFRLVALLAQVEQHQVAHLPAAGTIEHRSHQLGPLPVREMTPVSQVAGNQLWRSPRPSLHEHIMIEFYAKDIDIGQTIGHDLRPASRIGQITHSRRTAPPTGRNLDPKPEGRPVVPSRNGLDPKSARGQKRSIIELAHQPATLELLKTLILAEKRPMPLMAIQDDTTATHRLKRGRVDVVAMRMSQNHDRDPGPVRPDALEPLLENPWAQPDVDQQPRAFLADQCRITPRPTPEHGKVNSHHRFHLGSRRIRSSLALALLAQCRKVTTIRSRRADREIRFPLPEKKGKNQPKNLRSCTMAAPALISNGRKSAPIFSKLAGKLDHRSPKCC
jgi:hypothetical protein